jgi:hypothetical protein
MLIFFPSSITVHSSHVLCTRTNNRGILTWYSPPLSNRLHQLLREVRRHSPYLCIPFHSRRLCILNTSFLPCCFQYSLALLNIWYVPVMLLTLLSQSGTTIVSCFISITLSAKGKKCYCPKQPARMSISPPLTVLLWSYIYTIK